MKNVLPEVLAPLLNGENPRELAPDVEGMTSPKVRKLLNSLVARLPADEAYFEIGCYKGASLISALLDHKHVTAYACDNWSERRDHGPKELFFRNLASYRDRIPEVTFFEEDCFSLLRGTPFSRRVGVYFYDGDHGAAAQENALRFACPFLAPNVVVVVDDWNSEFVRKGTWLGIEAIRPRSLSFFELPARYNGDRENFWNGIGAFYLELIS